jgi:hypothetical protein
MRQLVPSRFHNTRPSGSTLRAINSRLRTCWSPCSAVPDEFVGDQVIGGHRVAGARTPRPARRADEPHGGTGVAGRTPRDPGLRGQIALHDRRRLIYRRCCAHLTTYSHQVFDQPSALLVSDQATCTPCWSTSRPTAPAPTVWLTPSAWLVEMTTGVPNSRLAPAS